MFDIIRSKSASWATKIIFGIIILVFIFWGVGNFSARGMHTVGKVNGDAITVNDFGQAFENILKSNPDLAKSLRENPDNMRAFKLQVFNNLALLRAIQQEAEKLGLFISQQELVAVISQVGLFQDANGKFSPAKYEEVLRAQKINPASFEADYIRQLLMDKLRNYVAMSVVVSDEEARSFFLFNLEERTADYVLFAASDYRTEAAPSQEEVEAFYAETKESFKLPMRGDYDYILLTPRTMAGSYKVTDEEVAAAYEKNKDKYRTPERFDASQIVLLAPADGDKKALDATVATINQRLAAGETFAKLVEEFSIDPSGKENGGTLGWMTANETLPEIVEAFSGIQIGQVTAPITLTDTVHIFRLNDKKPEGLTPLAEVKASLEETLTQEKARADFVKIQATAEEGLRQGQDFASLAKELKTEVKNTGLMPVDVIANNLGLGAEAAASLGYVPAGKAAPAPLEIADGLLLVFVREIKPEETPALDAVKASIVDTLTARKSTALAHAAAEKALPEITKSASLPAAYASKLKVTKPIPRLVPMVESLGSVPQLVNGLFTAPEGQWLPQVFDVNGGAIVTRVKSIQPAPEEQWGTMSGMFKNAMLQNKREEAIEAFLEVVSTQTKIEPYVDVMDSLVIN